MDILMSGKSECVILDTLIEIFWNYIHHAANLRLSRRLETIRRHGILIAAVNRRKLWQIVINEF